MKKITLYFILLFAFSSCKHDDINWTLARSSPRDAKLNVKNLIYSNDCSDLSSVKLKAWGSYPYTDMSHQWILSDAGDTGYCFYSATFIQNRISGYSFMDSAIIEIDKFIDKDVVIRFSIKDNYANHTDLNGQKHRYRFRFLDQYPNKRHNFGMSGGYNTLKVNNKFVNAALISKEYDEDWSSDEFYKWIRGWHKIQTEVISPGSNSIKILFPGGVYIDNIELWEPFY